jgi:Tol biopolymer transport system component
VGTFWARIADDGRTAFLFTRDELLPDLPPSDRYRVFAVDVATGALRLVTDDWRVEPEAISADGRLMVAKYHVDDDSDTAVLIDTTTGEVRDLLSFTGSLHSGDISADGSTIALSFDRSAGTAESKLELFLIDSATGAFDESLLIADGDLFHPHLSADGSVLAFSSYADNLSVGVGNDGSDAVVLDRLTNVMTFAYTTIDGDVADDQSVASMISADGSIVFIGTSATNLGGPIPAGSPPPYRFDRTTGATTAVVVPGTDVIAELVDTSRDGSRQLVSSDGDTSAYLYDVPSGRSVEVTRAAGGSSADGRLPTGPLANLSMNADGTVVVLVTSATNLGPDHDDVADVFVWELIGSELPEAPPTETLPTMPPEPPMPTEPTPPPPPVDVPVDVPVVVPDEDAPHSWICAPFSVFRRASQWCPTSPSASWLVAVVVRLLWARDG